jgi:mannose-6-phosphate isomerase-like protein (cupin superfamily)
MAVSTPQAQVFSYQRPDVSRPKTIVRLCGGSVSMGIVQIVAKDGGETNLHSHGGMDSIYFVLKGRVRFYSSEKEVLAELGPHEGVLIPHDFKYWFENAGDEPLEVLQVAGFVPNKDPNSRTNYSPMTAATVGTEFFDAGAPGQAPRRDEEAVYDPKDTTSSLTKSS